MSRRPLPLPPLPARNRISSLKNSGNIYGRVRYNLGNENIYEELKFPIKPTSESIYGPLPQIKVVKENPYDTVGEIRPEIVKKMEEFNENYRQKPEPVYVNMNSLRAEIRDIEIKEKQKREIEAQKIYNNIRLLRKNGIINNSELGPLKLSVKSIINDIADIVSGISDLELPVKQKILNSPLYTQINFLKTNKNIIKGIRNTFNKLQIS
jgi:hypothetical protein